MADDNLFVQFVSAEGVETGEVIALPVTFTPKELSQALRSVLESEEPIPYAFAVEQTAITTTLAQAVDASAVSKEGTIKISYTPQAVFRVRAVSRCTADLPGHTEPVLCTSFSPDGRILASGSGDTTVRLWDLSTQTPQATLKGHTNWVQQVSFSPDGKHLASAGSDNAVLVWNVSGTHGSHYRALKGHSKWINAVSWEPFHKNPKCSRLVTASADGSARIWDLLNPQRVIVLGGHSAAVKDVRWGGKGLIYTASADRTVRVWDADTGHQVRALQRHGHWVNSLALSTDYALRTGPFDHRGRRPESDAEAVAAALERYNKAAAHGECVASASDDFTICLFAEGSTKPTARLTGHQQPVNHIMFSPDGRVLASASFDHSVKLWDGLTGKFRASCRGHVQDVYRIAFSSDSRLLVSASKDSTLKCWTVATGKLAEDLPGHADQVYAVDWSPDGRMVASGGRDRVVKLWRH